MNFYYVSEGKLFSVEAETQRNIPSEAVAAYLRTVKDIKERREWKTTGQGARFMGVEEDYIDETEAYAMVEALASGTEKIVYAVSLENTCGIYSMEKADDSFSENYIVKKPDMRIHYLAYQEPSETIVASFGQGGVEKHLAVCNGNTGDFRVLTEGNSVDITPSFSKQKENEILFSSAGFYADSSGKIFYGAYAVNKLNLSTYNMEEILSDEKYDFLNPQQLVNGTIYCIRRPKTTPSDKNTIGDVAMVPVRIAKSVFSWLNVFSQRYTGESLLKKSGGINPAKNRQKTEGELFIEGNLINVEKSLQENALQDADTPGIIPKSWELVTIEGNVPPKVIASGVLSYYVSKNGEVVFSNGKYIKQMVNGQAIALQDASLAKHLSGK